VREKINAEAVVEGCWRGVAPSADLSSNWYCSQSSTRRLGRLSREDFLCLRIDTAGAAEGGYI